jgi:large subunit ribosomal protein L32
LTRQSAALNSDLFTNLAGVSEPAHALKTEPTPMANPKRKQSKRRSANRRAGNAFIAPEFAKDPTDGSAFRPHRVNPKNGMYRGRQVLNVEV